MHEEIERVAEIAKKEAHLKCRGIVQKTVMLKRNY